MSKGRVMLWTSEGTNRPGGAKDVRMMSSRKWTYL